MEKVCTVGNEGVFSALELSKKTTSFTFSAVHDCIMNDSSFIWSVGWILTLASHFLWVAVLHTKENESRERVRKENKKGT